MPRDRLANLIAVLVCSVLALPGQANAAGLQNVKVAGVSARIPSGCSTLRKEAAVHACSWENEDFSFSTFAMFSYREKRLSVIFSEMGLPSEPGEDLGVSLDAAIKHSKEGLGGPGDRLVHFEVSTVPVRRLPHGAEACRMVSKTEITEDPSASTPLGREMRLEKRELHCVTGVSAEIILSIDAIFVWTYKPGLGQEVPEDFDEQAQRIFATLVLLP